MQVNKDMLNDEQKFVLGDLIPKINNLVLNDKYKEVPLEDRMFCLSGSSGVGKTTLTSFILKDLEELGLDILVTAPTHKVKKVIQDMMTTAGVSFETKTIHSYLNLSVKNNIETGKQDLVQKANGTVDYYTGIIVEEASMISKELLEYIKAELEMNTYKFVLFLGDSYQLLSVGEEDSPVFNLLDITQYRLHKVMRQKGENPLIDICTILRDCIISGKYLSNRELKELFLENIGDHIEQVPDVKALLDRYFKSEYPSEDNSVIAYKNKTVGSLNQKIRNKIIDSDECFIQDEELIFLSAMVEQDIVVIANNEIITIQNLKKIHDSELDIDYWKIIDSEDRVFRAVDLFSKDDYEYELSELAKKAKKATGMERSAYWQRFFELKDTFQDVAYTYAGTVYKSQGSSYSEVFYHLDEVLSMRNILGDENLFRAIYVGISRCKHKLVILMK